MMTRASIALAGLAAAFFITQGCSSSSDGGGNTADGGTTDGGGSHDSGTADTGTSDTGASDTGTADSSNEAGGAPDCATYCTSIMANCTGANAQYTDATVCANVCAGFTAKGASSDMMGDTLGCRIYHAGAAGMSAAAATTHCPHAGPTGGDKDPKGTAGVCGEPCTSFCSIAAQVCTGANKQFADTTACTTACKMFAADTASYSTADTSKNDMGCRFYHLSAASKNAAAAMTHCPHIVVASAVCTQ